MMTSTDLAGKSTPGISDTGSLVLLPLVGPRRKTLTVQEKAEQDETRATAISRRSLTVRIAGDQCNIYSVVNMYIYHVLFTS